MASNKSRVNFAFACIVVFLGLIAGRQIYINLSSSTHLPATADNRPVAERETAGSQMPPDHPSPETVERLMTLERMISEDPKNPDYLTQAANLYYDVRQYNKAIDYYQQSLIIRPEVPGVETDLATSYHNLGQSDKALEILENVLQYQPDFPQAMFNKGVVLAYGKNDLQGAISIWEQLLRADPAFSQQVQLEQRINQLKASVR